MDLDPDDREVVACNGPTLAELRKASMAVMLQPYLDQMHEVVADALAEPGAAETVIELAVAATEAVEAANGVLGRSTITAAVKNPGDEAALDALTTATGRLARACGLGEEKSDG